MITSQSVGRNHLSVEAKDRTEQTVQRIYAIRTVITFSVVDPLCSSDRQNSIDGRRYYQRNVASSWFNVVTLLESILTKFAALLISCC